MSASIYLDANATTPVLPAAARAALQAMETCFGNPSSSHSAGLRAHAVLEAARASAVAVLGAGDGHVLFTSGATESLQTAILSALRSLRPAKTAPRAHPAPRWLVYGATEHKAVPQALAHWNTVLGLGLQLRALPVDCAGQLDLVTLADWLPHTALLCTMAANNETGVVTDLAAVEALLQATPNRALWLVDGVQALGKTALNLQGTRIDYAAFSGHKLYAPKGVGLLYVRAGAPFTALMAGGGQEAGMRSGTENLPGIAALGEVLQALLRGDTFASPATQRGYRDRLEQALRSAFAQIEFNAPLACSLPTTLNFSVPGLSAKTLVDVFDAAGLQVSAGSACSAAKSAPSAVLLAMGLSAQRSAEALRLSFGPLVDASTIHAACTAIARCGQALATPMATGGTSPAFALPAPDATDSGALAASLGVTWQALDAFLHAHPDACLIDVREPCEHLASGGLHWGARSARNVPMADVPELLHGLANATALVLICRSGKRSLQAAQWLHQQGQNPVRHVHGGLALRPH